MSDEERRRRRRFGLDQPGKLGERREGVEPVGRRRASVPAPARRRTERERGKPPGPREPEPQFRGMRQRPAGGDAPEPPPRSRLRWRLLALGCAALEVALVVLLCMSPLFRVREVQVLGATRVGGAQVVEASGVRSGTSIFLVNSQEITRRLNGQVWVRTSSVTTVLPGTVRITVDEWQPVAVYTPLDRSAVYLSAQGTILGSAGAHGSLPMIQGPDTGTAPGHLAVDERLLRPLVNIQQGLPGMIGQPVNHFQLDRCWNLTMYAGGGWRAMFGRMLTPSDYATLQGKVSALRSVAPDVNFKDSTVYVNLENPSEVTIGHGQDVAPTPTPTPTPSATPTPTPTATPTPGPVSAVTPTPKATPSTSPSPTPAAQGACS
ncbi:MAG: FtsQ-type POTRA domain-containing protein [Candidatus Dormibacteraeota bacterium]|nr:FtsQ-type POTRA domain-containing protein [Candidatus Dormibacteraeota bacterium]